MPEGLPKGLEEWGLVGGILVACFMLLRQLIVWMQGRIDAKDLQLAAQHDKALDVSNSVIRLADETATKTGAALDALAVSVKDMGKEICARMDRAERAESGKA